MKNLIFTYPKIAKTKINPDNIFKLCSNFELSVIGISHHNNSMNNIEKISRTKNKIYNSIQTNNIANEIICLQTCNRFELYTYSLNSTKTIIELEKLLSKQSGFIKTYKYINNDALRHIFRVSSGLDSMIFGEKQIESQVKKTIHELSNKKFYNLKKIFEKSIECSQQIRSISNFNKGDTSIASVCVDLFIDKINNSSKILIVGSGDTSKTLLNYFRNRQIFNIDLTNRNITNALRLKYQFNKLNISIIDYLLLHKIINNYDYVFMATSSVEPIIKLNDIKLNNFTKNLTIIDLCVPKNIETKCSKIKNICLFDIDKLKKIQLSNINNNKIILDRCNNIIKYHINKFNQSDNIII
jgi:glutamyl-tRNA reductase